MLAPWKSLVGLMQTVLCWALATLGSRSTRRARAGYIHPSEPSVQRRCTCSTAQERGSQLKPLPKIPGICQKQGERREAKRSEEKRREEKRREEKRREEKRREEKEKEKRKRRERERERREREEKEKEEKEKRKRREREEKEKRKKRKRKRREREEKEKPLQHTPPEHTDLIFSFLNDP
ncbi:hypothetical protein TURU_030273 [Turdus rufiventris]|nr:hypothetical protein TURU_030273 [Turdus rufiventris]